MYRGRTVVVMSLVYMYICVYMSIVHSFIRRYILQIVFGGSCTFGGTHTLYMYILSNYMVSLSSWSAILCLAVGWCRALFS